MAAKSARMRQYLYLVGSLVLIVVCVTVTAPMRAFRHHTVHGSPVPRLGGDIHASYHYSAPGSDAITVRKINISSDGILPNHGTAGNDSQSVPGSSDCRLARRFMPEGGMPYIALLSVPGSGNTWLRYLIEGVTGIYTGSKYFDEKLSRGGFVGESEPPRGGRVIAVKMHLLEPGEEVDGMIYLIRNPYDAIISDYNRICSEGNHTGTATEDAFRSKNWTMYAKWAAGRWEKSIRKYMEMTRTRKLVIFYEDLLDSSDSLSLRLRWIVSFLNLTLDEKRLECTLADREGQFRRIPHRLTFDPFTEDISSAVDSAVRNARKVMESFHGTPHVMKSYERDKGFEGVNDGVTDEEIESVCPPCKRLVQW